MCELNLTGKWEMQNIRVTHKKTSHKYTHSDEITYLKQLDTQICDFM